MIRDTETETFIYIIQAVRASEDPCGRLTFLIAGPTVWNSLPDELRDLACGSDSFKQFLKTILFSLY